MSVVTVGFVACWRCSERHGRWFHSSLYAIVTEPGALAFEVIRSNAKIFKKCRRKFGKVASKLNSCNPPLCCLLFLMYRHTKKKRHRILQIQRRTPQSAALFTTNSRSLTSYPHPIPIPTIYHHPSLSMSSSMMSTSIASVTNKLESANYLSYCEESQKLGTNDGSRYQLACVETSDLLEDVGWSCV